MTHEFKLKVEIGLTPQVEALLTRLLGTMPAAAPTLAAREEAAPCSDCGAAEPQETSEPNEAPAATTESVEAPEQPKAATVDVRAVIHETRCRIEGNDYAEADTEAKRMYHKLLTGEFKRISRLLGAEKPTELPEEQRAMFAKLCSELEAVDGQITAKLPF